MSRWRRSSGHSFGDYSDVAKESLVHRVCKEDKSLASSGLQVNLVETLGTGDWSNEPSPKDEGAMKDVEAGDTCKE
jgi:hypothetical protein